MSEAMLKLAEQGLAKRKANKVHQEKVAAGTVINPLIDARLVVWGEWCQGRHEECGGCGSMLGALIAGGGELIRSTATGSDMPDDVYDTESAVMSIEDKYRNVVFQQYLEVNRTPAERAKAVGCSERTFLRWLVVAQNQVLFYLRAPASKAPIRSAMLKRMSTV